MKSALVSAIITATLALSGTAFAGNFNAYMVQEPVSQAETFGCTGEPDDVKLCIGMSKVTQALQDGTIGKSIVLSAGDAANCQMLSSQNAPCTVYSADTDDANKMKEMFGTFSLMEIGSQN